MSAQILVVDDEAGIRELLADILADEGYAVALAANATEARAARNAGRPDLVLLDIWMPDTDGVTLLKEWARNGQLDMPVVMMSGHATIDTAVEATRVGAADFLEKPVALARLLETVRRQLVDTASAAGDGLLEALCRVSPPFERARAAAEALLVRDHPLLLVGPPGGAFEVFLPLLRRPGGPWVAVERQSQLADAPGELAERAAGGALWLADLAPLSRLEAKGLAIVANRRAQAGFRLAVGCSADPARLLADGRLEPGLFSALGPGRVDLPALRDAGHDAGAVAACLHAHLAPALGELAASVREAIGACWLPGDFVELRALLEQVQVLGADALDWARLQRPPAELAGDGGTPGAAPDAAGAAPRLDAAWFDVPLREARDAFERAYFEHHLARLGGQVAALADYVGLERTHLYRKLKQLGVRG
ncbi:MAG: sigma-54-dependent Fis family transcriptional regulator [Rhodocyclaceae bacterium]|nr:sigma-54-dependent Fis family transcriptional regulator [Rhodocyclaceae bacterium]